MAFAYIKRIKNICEAAGHTPEIGGTEDCCHYCSECNKIIDSTHSMSYTTTYPTCKTSGYDKGVCVDCGYTTTDILPATGHNLTWMFDLTNPDNSYCQCNNGENCDYYDDDHGYSRDYNLIYDEYKPATCGSSGIMRYVSNKFGATHDEVIPATGNHEFDQVDGKVPNPEWDRYGETYCYYVKCNHCDEVKYYYDHTWVLDDYGNPSYCSVCGATAEEVYG